MSKKPSKKPQSKQPPGFKWYARFAKSTEKTYEKVYKKFDAFCQEQGLNTEVAEQMLQGGWMFFPATGEFPPNGEGTFHISEADDGSRNLLYTVPLPESEFQEKYPPIFGGDCNVNVITDENVAEEMEEIAVFVEVGGDPARKPQPAGTYMQWRPLPMGTMLRGHLTEMSHDMLTVARQQLEQAEADGDERLAEMSRNLIASFETLLTTTMGWEEGWVSHASVRFNLSDPWHAVRNNKDDDASIDVTYCGLTGALALIDNQPEDKAEARKNDEEFVSVWGMEQRPWLGETQDSISRCDICQRIMNAEILQKGDKE